jgi:two-component system C4-dicarboxylate transport response regulator DctD
MKTVLLVDDDKAVREALGQTLDLAGFDVTLAASFIEATDHISPTFEGVVISDVRMPGKDGFALLERSTVIDPDIPVILLTGEGDIPMAVQAVNRGAFNFLEKPCPPKRLIEVAEKACSARRMVMENRAFRKTMTREDAAARLILGRSEATSQLRGTLRTVAATGTDLLITGETGVGKELAARVVHELSGREGAFVAVNCGMLTEEMTRMTLFGDDTHTGAFKRADGGTLFLDEIGSMPLDQQVNLLRILEDRTVDGPDGQPYRLSCCVIAATKEDLNQMLETGAFREDLFFRLDVARVRVPALRERIEDVGGLFRVFLSEARGRMNLPPLEVDEQSFSDLFAWQWRGNVRELKNHADRFAMGLDGAQGQEGPVGLNAQMDKIEKQIITDCLKRNKGQVTQTCEELQVPRKTLYDRMKRHDIQPEQFRGLE